jgi:hypothetical protein
MMELKVRRGWDYGIHGEAFSKYARLVLVDEEGKEISSLDLGEITAALNFIQGKSNG